MLLNEYRLNYKDSANRIPGWQNINKNELCNLYIENENNEELASAYLSAIVYDYWYLINKFLKLSYNVASAEDVYEWLLDSILYALKHRMWLNPKSSIYKDKNGPDKVINRCMKCRRLTYYQAINRGKRKGGFTNVSLDEMINNYNDSLDDLRDVTVDGNVESTIMLTDFIHNRFVDGDYFGAFLMDLIAYGNVFSKRVENNHTVTSMDMTKLIKQFTNKKEDSYAYGFAERYDLPKDKVKMEWDVCRIYDSKVIDEKIGRTLFNLSNSPYFEDKSGARKFKYYRKLTKKDKIHSEMDGEEMLDFGSEQV